MHLIQEFLRQFLAGLIMFRKGIKEFLLVDEVLVELRGQFHKVTRHVRSALRCILAAREHTMQAMTELVQEGAYLIISEQCRFLCRLAREIHHVHDMRTMVFLLADKLRLEIIHPRAAALTVPRMEVSVVHREELTLLVEDLVSRYFGVINLNLLVFFELDAIETLCEPEDTFLHCLQLEIRTEVIIRNIVFLFLEFLAVIVKLY